MIATGDTIIALASAPGRAERAILRLSGPAVPGILLDLTGPTRGRRGAIICDLALSPALRCPAILLRAPAPASYTGEDTAEFILPANPHLIERLIDCCCTVEGVRRAGPGEFTARAYLNGKLTLDEAEGVAAVIAAHSSDDLDAAQRLATGETGALYRAWASELLALLALVEAGIDFTDQEDVVPIPPAVLRARVASLRDAMAERAAGETAERATGLAPLVALVGPPNAGKSTLFNALLGRPRSVVADEAGTTRDAILEDLHLDAAAGPGLAVRLADLPGLDTAVTGPANLAAQARAREILARADALLHCDPAARFEHLAAPTRTPILRVRTKADLPQAAPGREDLAVCALDGWRLDLLRRAIADLALGARGSCSVALARHAGAIAHAARALNDTLNTIDPDAHALAAPELVAERLREAVTMLDEVLGRVTPDDVLGRIFAAFCVGK